MRNRWVFPILLAVSALRAQTPASPEIVLDVNGQSDAVVSRGWPFLIRILLISADGQPVSLALKNGPWTQALTLSITAGGGASQRWPAQLVQPSASTLSLSGLVSAEAVWLVAPSDTASIPDGVYNLSVTLDTGSSAAAGAWTGSITGSAALTVRGEPASPSAEDDASKYLALAAYARLKGDSAGLAAALDTLIARQPTVLEAYREKADLLAAAGDYGGALAIYEDTIARYLASHPNSTEPIGLLTRPVSATAAKLAQQQSGATAVTSVAPGRTDTVFAPDSIVSAYGVGLATSTAVAAGSLTASLAGTAVTIRASDGASAPALLFSVSPNQVNYAAPGSLKLGPATVTITSGDGSTHTGSVTIADVEPAVFTLNAAGLIAASIVRVTDAGQVSENVYTVDASNSVVALPVDVAKDQVYLVLYATGIRRAAQSEVKVSIAGVDLPVAYAGPQGFYTGLDQVNVQLPSSLAGRGDVPVSLTVRGTPANASRITFK